MLGGLGFDDKMSDLLCCPFCGESEVEDLTLTIHIHGEKADRYNVEGGTDESVYCWNCGANTLKRWWNKRAT